MGRQAHITTLALGRSPFEEPLRDEDGNFILGPHAHDNDGPGYTQQFNERGHPQNRASKAAARRLRRAQNDVLATVGVVVKKGEDRKTKWERLEDNQKYDIVFNENVTGSQTKGEDRVAGVILPWAIVSLRRRIMTFGDYFSVPLSNLTMKEQHLFGVPRILLAGLPIHSLSTLPQMFRYYICDPNVEGIVNYISPWREPDWCDTIPTFIKWHSTTMIMRCIEVPLLVHATLQSLQITPANIGLSWKSFIPFSTLSPIVLPAIPSTLSTETLVAFAFDLAQTPVYIYLIRDYLQVELGYRLYALFRQLLTKPDRPDTISAKVSDETDTIEETSIAGIGSRWPGAEYERTKRSYGPRSFLGALRVAFPPVYSFLNYLSGDRLARSRGRLTPLLDRQLRTAVRERYWEERLSLDNRPKRGSPDDLAFRQFIVNTTFSSANLNLIEELVDPVAWTNETLGPKADEMRGRPPGQPTWNNPSARRSHSRITTQEALVNYQQDLVVSRYIAEALRVMPNSDAVVIEASDAEVVMYTHDQSATSPRAPWQLENIHRINAADIPFAALIRAVNQTIPDAEQIQPPEERSWQPGQPQSGPPSPSPGITRAMSLADAQSQTPGPALPTLRPLRRPTETDDSLAAISETLRAEAENPQSPRGFQPPSPVVERHALTLRPSITPEPTVSDPPLTPMKHRQYRVTMLSNHPADSLAWHASALLTSLILWPVEAMWLRSVAKWALANPAMGPFVDPWWAARLGFGVIGQGRPVSVFGLTTWFGGATDSGGRMKYVGSILLTLGLEGMVRGACWGVGVWFVKRSREKFGWGQF